MVCMVTLASTVFCSLIQGLLPRMTEANGNFYFNFTNYQVMILMAEDYELDLSDGGFAYFLEYEKRL